MSGRSSESASSPSAGGGPRRPPKPIRPNAAPMTEVEMQASRNSMRKRESFDSDMDDDAPPPTPLKIFSNPLVAPPAPQQKRLDRLKPDIPIARDFAGTSAANASGFTNMISPQEEPVNLIYHKHHFSMEWMLTASIMHIVQFAVLFSVGYKLMSNYEVALNLILAVFVLIFFLLARIITRKGPETKICCSLAIQSPKDEKDEVPDSAIYLLGMAAIFEGAALALFPALNGSASDDELNLSGLYSTNTIVQTLSFATLTFYAIHKILRPANRLDPLRTVLELEVASVCWDALDGSSLFELFRQQELDYDLAIAARVLMIFWYLSVGFRLAVMFWAHLNPSASIAWVLMSQPKSLSPEPTVDRSLQALRLRSLITFLMSGAELFALAFRITLFYRGELNSLQQEMMIKNFLFLTAIASAYSMLSLTSSRTWNTRQFFCFEKPSRRFQIQVLRWLFALTYVIMGGLFTAYLVRVEYNYYWFINVGTDFLFIFIFLAVFRNLDNKNDWVMFPAPSIGIMSAVLTINMYAARIPGIFFSYDQAMEVGGTLWTFNNGLLLISVSIVPMALCALFWSTSYMMFHPEFTAAPGNYNAIHDPVNMMVSVSSMVDGALDVVSCASLMSLAQITDLNVSVENAIVLFCYLEIINACQGFALQATLSGGHEDLPQHLVQWKAKLRVARGVIDFGAFILRLYLWLEYDAMNSVFIVKNLYNILHTISQVERAAAVRTYPKDILFAQFVRPQDWYGMSQQEWRQATSDTIASQAQSGRQV